MPNFQYGLAGFKNLGNTTNDTIRDTLSNLASSVVSARVFSIDPITGNITANIMGLDPAKVGNIVIEASPLFPNIKNYPLINEVVLLITAVSSQYQSSTGSSKYYYITPVNLWNTQHTNPTVLPQEPQQTPTSDKTYSEVEAGSSNKSSVTEPEVLKPGTYFTEKGNVPPLFPFEGDLILDGRFGNSIRLGSTDISGSIPLNSWSSSPSNGDPITILRNGSSITSNDGYTPTVENINTDLSSIWLTSTQKLPITGSSISYSSYTQNPPTALNQYSGQPQIVLNSGRLVLNSTLDHILLSSKTSINLNSVNNVNVDTNNFVVQSAKVYLGDSEDSLTQPVVLGDDLVSLLTDILTDLNTLTRTLQNQVGVPVGTPLAPTSLAAQLIADKIPSYKRRVSQLLSNTTRTAV